MYQNPAVLIPTLTFFGLLIGSFLNVVAIRIPRGESIVFPPSHCMSCQTKLKPYDLVPVLSYLFSLGKCRHCGVRISPSYAIGEALTGILFGLMAWQVGLKPELWVALFFVSILVVIVHTDIRLMIIPDRVMFFAIPVLMIGRIFVGASPYWHYWLAGAFAGLAIQLIIWCSRWLLKKEAMGGGDVTLFAFIGLALGPQLVALAFFFACALGAIIGILLILLRILKRGQYMPFGPYVALASLIVYLWGKPIWEWYMELAAF